MSLIDEQAEAFDAQQTEVRALEHRGEVSQLILEHHAKGPEVLLAALIGHRQTHQPQGHDRDLVTTNVEARDGRIVFSAGIDSTQLQPDTVRDGEAAFSGATHLKIGTLASGKKLIKERMNDACQALDDLRVTYNLSRKRDGFALTVDEQEWDRAFKPVKEGNLETDDGRLAALKAFWTARDERQQQDHGHKPDSTAAREARRMLTPTSAERAA